VCMCVCVCVCVPVHVCLCIRDDHEHSNNEKLQTVSLGDVSYHYVTITTKTHLTVFLKFRPIPSNSRRDGSASFCEDKNSLLRSHQRLHEYSNLLDTEPWQFYLCSR
jgi:hypothetical protein